ncbi:DUF7146 domain-containing protein [Pseudochelatococcus lubricantis]|uniref:DUF7146 domain-containing protein n=1 Tax=Pseudochelatococcus lubricantis TaxID=1538102 RepID=UPI00406BC540
MHYPYSKPARSGQAFSAHDIARALGGEARGNNAVVPGPGHSRKDRSLSVTISASDPDGFVVKSHCNDDWRECRDYVRAALGLTPWRPGQGREDERPRERRRPVPSPEPNRNQKRALDIWSEAIPIRGTLAASYLRSRAVVLDDDDLAHGALRFHPSVFTSGGDRHPAMIALYRDIFTDAPAAIQKTYLSPLAEKIDREMFGPVKGAAIKLDPDAEVTGGITVAEGCETALSGRVLGHRPAWALGSAGMLGAFPVLHEAIEAITILGETDDNGANAKACDELADRWLAAGREVVEEVPNIRGDMNDVLKGAAKW